MDCFERATLPKIDVRFGGWKVRVTIRNIIERSEKGISKV
jgi:hypothetical protein